MQRKLNQRERMAYATVARLEAQLREKDQILSAVHEQFQRFGDRFPDGFDSRIFRWVADAMAGSAEPSTCQRCAGTGIWYPATGSNERQRCPEGCAPVERDELPEFARTVIAKLARFRDCAEDGQGVDIGRNWFDTLVQLGLLHRVQRSPAMWEITCEGDALLESRAALDGKP